MAKPLRPYVRGRGFYPSRKYTPLVYPGGYTTRNASTWPHDPLGTFSGAIARFHTIRSMPIQSLKVNMSPIQDLHGYDSPWPAGRGKNKFNKDDASSLLSLFINPETGNLNTIAENRSAVIPCKASTTYTVSNAIKTTLRVSSFVNAPASGSLATVHNSPEGQSEAGTGLTITTGANDAYLVVQFIANADISAGVTAEQAIAQLMVEEGSSVSAWSPYENICPISGWTGVSVWRDGKNLLDPTYRQNLTSNVRFYITNGLLLKANTAYTFSVSSPSAQNQITAKDGTRLAINYGENYLTYTPTKDVLAWFDAYYAGSFPPPSGGTATINCQLEIGSTATDYEPYNGNSYPVTWEDEVFGCEVDVVSGERKETGNIIVITADDAKEITVEGNNVRINLSAGIITDRISYQKGLCDRLTVCTSWGSVSSTPNGIAINYPSNNQLIVNKAQGTTLEEIKALFGTGFQLYYPLATPVETTITPTPINALKGTNVVWSNVGDVTVTAHGTPIVEPDAEPLQALNLLLGGAYRNDQTPDDVSDEEALEIILGSEQR